MSHPVLLLPQRGLMLLVRGYRLLLSPWFGNSCRFEPSCSAYALQALERHGAAAGSYFTVCRLARCHPWCEPGFDPVPEQAPALLSRWLPAADAAGRTPVRPATHPTPLPDKNFP
jgi:putative membrane protein insertion efficiency factor